jgi:transcriptional regulator with XRE-family HTH domain
VPDARSLGARLRARRIELDLTLADVADRSGLSLPYVSNLERGRGNPTVDALRALAGALETPLSSLIEDEGSEPIALVLAEAPKSLMTFARTKRFAEAVEKLAQDADVDSDEMRRRVLVGMASAPRRSVGEPTEDDWRRLLDVYSLILNE